MMDRHWVGIRCEAMPAVAEASEASKATCHVGNAPTFTEYVRTYIYMYVVGTWPIISSARSQPSSHTIISSRHAYVHVPYRQIHT